MRGAFADPATNFASHSDVIARHRGAGCYAETMRTIIALLCSFLLLAILFGLAHPEISPQGTHVDTLYAQPLIPDAVCGEGSGHGTCQLVISDRPLLFSLTSVVGSPHFTITPVAATSRSFGPVTPPPRRVI